MLTQPTIFFFAQMYNFRFITTKYKTSQNIKHRSLLVVARSPRLTQFRIRYEDFLFLLPIGPMESKTYTYIPYCYMVFFFKKQEKFEISFHI